LPSCVPPFLPLPITRYVFFFFALLSLAFIYPLKPWLSPPLFNPVKNQKTFPW